ncbi:MAG: asparagine synthase (glutamine-hydrolyzing) [Phycisphaerales bacterium]|nr:asparagine synthase (glutamine-hydrolyzing) [Phycisphaerales bacterium]
MCGIAGIVSAGGRGPGVTPEGFVALRDRLAHRGPDGAGVWADGGGVAGAWGRSACVLGHRRLAIVEPGEAGQQPMALGGRWVVTYNGELYNDAAVRAELRESVMRSGAMREGADASLARFETASDTETLLRALAVWGADGLARLRGMYALALWDARERTLLLARDPLGVKPLYWARDGERVVFASEAAAVVAHPGIGARPDLAGVSAYLTTLRTSLGERTMFEGVRAVEPGGWVRIDASGDALRITRGRVTACEAWERGCGNGSRESTRERVGAVSSDMRNATRAVVEDSVAAHLRSDRPVCQLLSGGLDSSIIASCIARLGVTLDTYCVGGGEGGEESPDFAAARVMAAHLARAHGGRTAHTEVRVTRELFGERWRELVARQGTPLSTPNEVAIHEVSRVLRSRGHVVALSGEGADEVFAGYELPLRGAMAHVHAGDDDPGAYELDANAWVARGVKEQLLGEDAWRSLEEDHALVEGYRALYDGVREEERGAGCPTDDAAGRALARHVMFHRRVNLTGLLARLDSATMLEGVEGRVPLADAWVCAWGESLPMRERFVVDGDDAASSPARTKVALREAFRDELPAEVVSRAKASFPMPMSWWSGGAADVLLSPGPAASVFRAESLAFVAARTDLWNLAWPVANVVMWMKRWWG